MATTFDRSRIRAAIEEAYVEAFVPNATYDEAPSPEELMQLDVIQAAGLALGADVPVSLDGPPGTGKTSMLKHIGEILGLQVEVINAAQITPDNLVLPAKQERPDVDFPFLDFTLDSRLMTDQWKLIIIDDKSRAAKHVQNMLLEFVQSRAIQGKRIPRIAAIMGTDNVGKREGITKAPDRAQRDRWATFPVTSASTAWRRALAAKYPEVDLSGAFQVYNTLTPEIRWYFSPRKLDHLLYNLIRGNPGEWAVSIVSGTRRWWGEESYTLDQRIDKTFELIDKVASAIGTSNRTSVSEPAKRAVDCVIEDGVNAYIESPPGFGKTAYISDYVRERNIELIALSGPTMMPDDLVFPAVHDDQVVRLPNGRFIDNPGQGKVLLLDEVWRSSAPTRNALMPVLQEKCFGGIYPPDFIGTIAANNPREVAGEKLDVGRPDPAQADRFPVSIMLKLGDIPSLEWLLATYGEYAEPVVEWYQEDLPDSSVDPSRYLVTMRALERIIHIHKLNSEGWEIPLESAMPRDTNGDMIPVPMGDLRARLGGHVVAKLKTIIAEVDHYVELLEKGEDEEPTAHNIVFRALAGPTVTQLEAQRPALDRLFNALARQHQVVLLRQRAEGKQDLWKRILLNK